MLKADRWVVLQNRENEGDEEGSFSWWTVLGEAGAMQLLTVGGRPPLVLAALTRADTQLFAWPCSSRCWLPRSLARAVLGHSSRRLHRYSLCSVTCTPPLTGQIHRACSPYAQLLTCVDLPLRCASPKPLASPPHCRNRPRRLLLLRWPTMAVAHLAVARTKRSSSHLLDWCSILLAN
jgi:hypothetical protein